MSNTCVTTEEITKVEMQLISLMNKLLKEKQEIQEGGAPSKKKSSSCSIGRVLQLVFALLIISGTLIQQFNIKADDYKNSTGLVDPFKGKPPKSTFGCIFKGECDPDINAIINQMANENAKAQAKAKGRQKMFNFNNVNNNATRKNHKNMNNFINRLANDYINKN